MWVLNYIWEDAEWTKMAPIGPLLRVSKPVALWEHRGVVLKYGPDGKYLVFYNYSTQELRITDIPNQHIEYNEHLI